jgi:hypothetical protein
VRDEISESSSLSEGVGARNRTVGGFAVAGFGVAERRPGVAEREIGVAERIAERIGGTVDLTLEGKTGEIGSVSCAASLLDL